MTSTRKARSVRRRRDLQPVDGLERAMLSAVSTPIVTSEPHRSLSMVRGHPDHGKPIWLNACEPVCDPLPPITTRPSMPSWRRCRSARMRPSSRRNSGRARSRKVPPRSRMPARRAGRGVTKLPLIRPAEAVAHAGDRPPRLSAVRCDGADRGVHAGASPPEVRTGLSCRWSRARAHERSLGDHRGTGRVGVLRSLRPSPDRGHRRAANSKLRTRAAREPRQPAHLRLPGDRSSIATRPSVSVSELRNGRSDEPTIRSPARARQDAQAVVLEAGQLSGVAPVDW